MSWRDERGFTLVELLTAMTIFILVLAATLTTFTTFARNESQSRKRADAHDQVRTALDQVARQLRNLANPNPGTSTSTIDLAGDYDIVFQTSDPDRLRVRYCLAPAAGGVGEKLWFQSTLAAPTFDPAWAGSCPGTTGWDVAQTHVVAENVVNRIGGANRPVFSYGCADTVPTGGECSSTSALRRQLVVARSDLYLDVNDAQTAPAETRLSTAVFLRNQNQEPTASFVAASGGSRTVVLNASGSDDPEGRTMRFEWYLGSDALPPACKEAGVDYDPDAYAPLMGTGVTLSHTFASDVTTTQQVRLRVIDPGCQTALAGPTSINPTTGSPT